jgi:hypothetical protein
VRTLDYVLVIHDDKSRESIFDIHSYFGDDGERNTKQTHSESVQPCILSSTTHHPPWLMANTLPISLLPTELLLQIASYLSLNTLLAFSNSCRTIYILSLTSTVYWENDIVAAHLNAHHDALAEYHPLDLRCAALEARRAWRRISTPRKRIQKGFTPAEVPTPQRSLQMPLEANQYANQVSPGTPWLFFIIPREWTPATTHPDETYAKAEDDNMNLYALVKKYPLLACKDLRTGRLLGTLPLIVDRDTTKGDYHMRELAVASVSENVILIALLSEYKQSW